MRLAWREHGVDVQYVDRHPANPPERTADAEMIRRLADDIAVNGLRERIEVRAVGKRWQLIAGERRLCACKLLGWEVVDAKSTSVDDRRALELLVSSNDHCQVLAGRIAILLSRGEFHAARLSLDAAIEELSGEPDA